MRAEGLGRALEEFAKLDTAQQENVIDALTEHELRHPNSWAIDKAGEYLDFLFNETLTEQDDDLADDLDRVTDKLVEKANAVYFAEVSMLRI